MRRVWQAGDEVRLRLDMTPRWTSPDRRVDAVRGCAAIERGPLVYCFEQADQRPSGSTSSPSAGLMPLAERDGHGLDGVGATIQDRRRPPPRRGPGPPGNVPAIAIPYFQWDNRGPG